MAISTAITTLKYTDSCNAQVETLSITGTITSAGNATVTVTSRDIPTSPVTISVAVALNDTATQIATKVRTALQNNADISSAFIVNGTGSNVVLTRRIPTSNDDTLNIAITNGTCAGITPVTTSTNTTSGGTFTKLCDIVSYPDLGSAPSKLDTTTLSDDNKTSILGLQDSPDLTFDANYDENIYNTINNLNKSNYYIQLEFGDNNGRFDWQGQIKAYVNGGGVDEVRKMTIVISASTPITFTAVN